MRQNLHTHATFCDGKNTPEELVHEAIRMDLDALGFSSHAPLAGQEDWTMSPEDVPRYRAEILRLKERYAGRLEIFLGLEQDYYSPPPGDGWDYLIGSVHCVEREGRLLPADSSAGEFVRNARQYYGGDFLTFAEDYYRLVGEVAEKTGCQIVGHFDLVTKFNEGDRLFATAHPRYRRAALEALDRLAERDVIVEINTGAMSRGYRSEPYPAPWLLRAMRERGLPICITSDCHDRANLLYAFAQAEELARSCGYGEKMVLTGRGFVPAPL